MIKHDIGQNTSKIETKSGTLIRTNLSENKSTPTVNFKPNNCSYECSKENYSDIGLFTQQSSISDNDENVNSFQNAQNRRTQKNEFHLFFNKKLPLTLSQNMSDRVASKNHAKIETLTTNLTISSPLFLNRFLSLNKNHKVEKALDNINTESIENSQNQASKILGGINLINLETFSVIADSENQSVSIAHNLEKLKERKLSDLQLKPTKESQFTAIVHKLNSGYCQNRLQLNTELKETMDKLVVKHDNQNLMLKFNIQEKPHQTFFQKLICNKTSTNQQKQQLKQEVSLFSYFLAFNPITIGEGDRLELYLKLISLTANLFEIATKGKFTNDEKAIEKIHKADKISRIFTTFWNRFEFSELQFPKDFEKVDSILLVCIFKFFENNFCVLLKIFQLVFSKQLNLFQLIFDFKELFHVRFNSKLFDSKFLVNGLVLETYFCYFQTCFDQFFLKLKGCSFGKIETIMRSEIENFFKTKIFNKTDDRRFTIHEAVRKLQVENF